MNFIIKLNTDNAAFDSEDSDEVRKVLAEVADQISDPTASGGSVRDTNGNTVCTWTCD